MKVAILGFGVEGKDAANYFIQKKAEITVFDKKTENELQIATFLASKGRSFQRVGWILGERYLDSGLNGFDLIVRSPGIRPDIPQITQAVEEGAKLTSTTKIFFDECKVPIIGISGTKGKGTTSSLIKASLDASGFKTVLLGNIGDPMLSSLDKADNSDWVILELSSFQTIDLHKSPRIAVVTNITTDHMDWHTSQDEYEKAKEQLWVNQDENSFAIFNWDDITSKKLGEKAHANTYWFSLNNSNFEFGAFLNNEKVFLRINNNDIPVGKSSELKIPGKHNIANALAALCAGFAAGGDTKSIWQGIGSFEGLEHRLEKIAEINGATYVNDSYATNPEPTLAAIRSFEQPKVLILGGSKKGADFNQMAKEITNSNVRGIVLIGDEAENIKNALNMAGFKGEVSDGGKTMPDMVSGAKSMAQEGDIVLLSPACASFGLFENYKDRGKQFKEAVLSLSSRNSNL